MRRRLSTIFLLSHHLSHKNTKFNQMHVILKKKTYKLKPFYPGSPFLYSYFYNVTNTPFKLYGTRNNLICYNHNDENYSNREGRIYSYLRTNLHLN